MATVLPSELLADVLDTMPVARLAVIDAAGRPDTMPIVFARVGDWLFSPIDGKPKKHPRLARLAHIRQHPQVTLTLDHYGDDWQSLWWIRLEVEAHIAVGSHACWDEAVTALTDKYPQYQTTPLFLGEPTLIALERQALRWWAASGVDGVANWLSGGKA